MSARLAQYVGVAAGTAIFGAAALWPAAALILRAATAAAPEVPYRLAAGLLMRSVLLAAGGASAACVFALPGAWVVARMGRRGPGIAAGVLIAPLLFPAMIYAFGWDRLIKTPAELRCLWVWATWAWPAPALMLGSGWNLLGRGRYEAALLSAGPLRAFLHGVFPMLWRHVLVSWLVLFAFFLGDYAVPHACGLIVYATELLLAAESTHNARAVLMAALPVAGVITIVLLAALAIWRNRPEVDASDDADLAGSAGRVRLLALLLTVLCVGVPLVGLMRSVPVVASLRETVNTYGGEIVASVGVAAAGGLAAVLMGAALSALPGVRHLVAAMALLWATLPGALIGSAVISAYLPLSAVYDHWVIMVIGYVARFGWVGVLIGLLSRASVGRAHLDAARADGAGAVTAAWRIALAGNLPILLCGWLIITALNLSEAATTALVRVPEVNPISLILIEKFHRFEDGILVGISVLLVAATLPGAVAAGLAKYRRR